MSCRTYSVAFANSALTAAIRETLPRMARREIPDWRREALAKLEWSPIQGGEFKIPDELFEFDVPDEWSAADGIKGEKVMVSTRGDGLTLILSDGNMREESCEQVVRRFVQELHTKATGRALAEEEIKVSTVAFLPRYVCEFCSGQITDLPYTCPVCGRCFCYEHRRPETHGCERARATNKTCLSDDRTLDSARSRKQGPTVLVRKVPCG